MIRDRVARLALATHARTSSKKRGICRPGCSVVAPASETGRVGELTANCERLNCYAAGGRGTGAIGAPLWLRPTAALATHARTASNFRSKSADGRRKPLNHCWLPGLRSPTNLAAQRSRLAHRHGSGGDKPRPYTETRDAGMIGARTSDRQPCRAKCQQRTAQLPRGRGTGAIAAPLWLRPTAALATHARTSSNFRSKSAGGRRKPLNHCWLPGLRSPTNLAAQRSRLARRHGSGGDKPRPCTETRDAGMIDARTSHRQPCRANG